MDLIDISNLNHHFLIATPKIKDKFFNQAVVYIGSHDSKGSFGIVINKAVNISVEDCLLHQEVSASAAQPYAHHKMHAGGPLYTEQCFVLHHSEQKPTWSYHIASNQNIHLTASYKVLTDPGYQTNPNQAFICIGAAKWKVDQLEKEIINNLWIVCPATPSILFDTPSEQRLQTVLERSGISLTALSQEQGHS